MFRVASPRPRPSQTAETHGPHYRGTLLTSGQHMGHAHEHRDSPQHQHFIAANAPITILRLEFFEEPSSQSEEGIFMMESDIYTEEDWDEIKSSELERWIEEGLDMDSAHEQALSENDTEPE
jgi:hypothetical protein